jgi:dienelactone hydrolase
MTLRSLSTQRLARAAGVAVLTAARCFAAGADAYAGTRITLETLAAPGPFAVGMATLPLVDPTRPTPASASAPGSPVRTLMTDVYYPAAAGVPGAVTVDAPADEGRRRFPLLVFAHGLFGARGNWAGTLAHLASHGYVVAAPDFPLTNLATFSAGTTLLADLVNQPGDVSFAIDTFTGVGNPLGEPLSAVVDTRAVGVLGHSYGGATAFLAVFGGPLADGRIGAVAAAAPLTCPFGRDMFAGKSPPFLVLHGTSDLIIDPAWSRDTFGLMPAPRFFTELVGGDHLGFVSDPTLPAMLRDTNLLPLFVAGLARFGGQFTALGAVLASVVPGIDATRCLTLPILPDPELERDPVMAVEDQRRITNVTLTAFFDAFLRRKAAARRFFLRRLPSSAGFGDRARYCKATRKHPHRPCNLPTPAPSAGAAPLSAATG